MVREYDVKLGLRGGGKSWSEEKEMSLDDASTRDLEADLYHFCRPMVLRPYGVPAGGGWVVNKEQVLL